MTECTSHIKVEIGLTALLASRVKDDAECMSLRGGSRMCGGPLFDAIDGI